MRDQREGASIPSFVDSLRDQVKDLAFQLPAGDAATVRLEALLMGLVQELSRLDGQVRDLVEEVLGERRYAINEEPRRLNVEHGVHAGSDGGVRPDRAASIADHYARV